MTDLNRNEDDPLAPFRDGGASPVGAQDYPIRRRLLIFHFGALQLAVPAEAVDAVISFRRPSPIPLSDVVWAGVVQDRGRVVAVLRKPFESAGDIASARRILVCRTRRGYVGIPARRTRGVFDVGLAHEPIPGEVLASTEGNLTFLDPPYLAPMRSGVAGAATLGGGRSVEGPE